MQIRNVILNGTKSLVEAAQSLGYLKEQLDAVQEPLPAPECSFAALCEMAKALPLVEEEGDCSQPLVAGDGSTSHVDLFSRVTENSSDQALVVTLMGQEYVIPPNTAFLLSDFVRIQPIVQCEYNGCVNYTCLWGWVTHLSKWTKIGKTMHNCFADCCRQQQASTVFAKLVAAKKTTTVPSI